MHEFTLLMLHHQFVLIVLLILLRLDLSNSNYRTQLLSFYERGANIINCWALKNSSLCGKQQRFFCKTMSNEGGKRIDYFYDTKDERDHTLTELQSGKEDT